MIVMISRINGNMMRKEKHNEKTIFATNYYFVLSSCSLFSPNIETRQIATQGLN